MVAFVLQFRSAMLPDFYEYYRHKYLRVQSVFVQGNMLHFPSLQYFPRLLKDMPHENINVSLESELDSHLINLPLNNLRWSPRIKIIIIHLIFINSGTHMHITHITLNLDRAQTDAAVHYLSAARIYDQFDWANGTRDARAREGSFNSPCVVCYVCFGKSDDEKWLRRMINGGAHTDLSSW